MEGGNDRETGDRNARFLLSYGTFDFVTAF